MQGEASSLPSDRVTIEIADGVAEVTLNRPDKLNALDPAMFEAIIAAGERLSRNKGLRAVVLVGAGKGFAPASTRRALRPWPAGAQDNSSPISSRAPTGSPMHGSRRLTSGARFPFR
jgi:hypothetical protein